jgi:methylenetetrahydrofolate reductase (NADPH)
MALTAECFPPRGCDPQAVKKLATCFPAAIDAVVVADNAEEVRSSALACAALLARENLQTVLTLVTRDRNRIALQSDVLGAAALGVGGILCLTGEHQSLQLNPQAAGSYDIDSIQLCQALQRLCKEGVDFAGKKLDAPPELLVGAAAHPYLRPMDLNLLRLKKKVQAGADVLLTQAVFDLAGFTEWMKAVQAAGLDKRVAIIASVLPLRSVEQARTLQAKKTYGPVGDDVIACLAKAADPAKEGVAICVEKAKALKAMAGVRGIHILCGGFEESAQQIIRDAGLAG